MKHIEYIPSGVCSRKISFDLSEDNTIHNLAFVGGCQGNLAAIAKLVEGKASDQVAKLLIGNTCGLKRTSCADQLANAITEALSQKKINQ